MQTPILAVNPKPRTYSGSTRRSQTASAPAQSASTSATSATSGHSVLTTDYVPAPPILAEIRESIGFDVSHIIIPSESDLMRPRSAALSKKTPAPPPPTSMRANANVDNALLVTCGQENKGDGLEECRDAKNKRNPVHYFERGSVETEEIQVNK